MDIASETAPLVTVCTPTYNRAHFLRQCLHSLCDQGLGREQYVVAISDNASTDDTPDVVAAYRDRLQILYRRNAENLGHAKNFELVMAMCATPYIALLPDDDLLSPGHLGRALSALAARERAALLSSFAVMQAHPGALNTQVHGTLLRADERTSYEHPYVWGRAEWLALALVATPLSIIGSVFRSDAFRSCVRWRKYPIWGDRLLLAEMSLHGEVITLPWVGGHYRVGDHQTNYRLSASHPHDFEAVTAEVLELCETHGVPVLDFWVEQICTCAPHQRGHYLGLLRGALPGDIYRKIVSAAEGTLKERLTGGRLESWGVPASLAAWLRAARSHLRLL